MRPIKFRAYYMKEEEKAVHDKPYAEWSPKNPNCDLAYVMSDSDYRTVQYTGFKDKNGVEIYEGDIVECVEKEMFNKRKNHIKFISPVFWDQLSWTLRESETCDVALSVYEGDESKRPVTTIKVIGNIYENPNLVEPPLP